MSSKYIVRQQIKDAKGAVIGYEIVIAFFVIFVEKINVFL